MDLESLLRSNSGLSEQIFRFIQGWNTSNSLSTIPSYKEFSPKTLSDQLPHTVILEMDKAGGVFYRLCGSDVEKVLKRYMTNVQASDLYDHFAEAYTINEIYSQAIIQGAGMLRISNCMIGKSRKSIPFITLYLPISNIQSLGNNYLLGLVITSEEALNSNAYANIMDETDQMSESWDQLIFLDIDQPFNRGLISRQSLDFFEKKGLKLESMLIEDLVDMLEAHNDPELLQTLFQSKPITNL